MTATVPSLRMLLEEAAQQAYDQGGRWEKQCACRKMIGLRVDSSCWLDRKAPPRTWHLVER